MDPTLLTTVAPGGEEAPAMAEGVYERANGLPWGNLLAVLGSLLIVLTVSELFGIGILA